MKTLDPKAGHWQGLAGQSSLYSVIATKLAGCGSVLDVGCGEGHLQGYLAPGTNYLGLEQHAHLCDGIHRIQADVTTYDTERQFDAVVFNESLYYLPGTWAIITRYCSLLTPDGVIVVSIWRNPRWRSPNRVTRFIAGRFFKFYEMPTRRTVLTEDKLTWDIFTAKVRRAEA